MYIHVRFSHRKKTNKRRIICQHVLILVPATCITLHSSIYCLSEISADTSRAHFNLKPSSFRRQKLFSQYEHVVTVIAQNVIRNIRVLPSKGQWSEIHVILKRLKVILLTKYKYDTSLSFSKNAEYPPIARCSEYFDEILVPFSSCMLMELLEQTVKFLEIALNFQTADAI